MFYNREPFLEFFCRTYIVCLNRVVAYGKLNHGWDSTSMSNFSNVQKFFPTFFVLRKKMFLKQTFTNTKIKINTHTLPQVYGSGGGRWRCSCKQTEKCAAISTGIYCYRQAAPPLLLPLLLLLCRWSSNCISFVREHSKNSSFFLAVYLWFNTHTNVRVQTDIRTFAQSTENRQQFVASFAVTLVAWSLVRCSQ